MTDLMTYPECHLSAPIKKRWKYEWFEIWQLDNDEWCVETVSRCLYTQISPSHIVHWFKEGERCVSN